MKTKPTLTVGPGGDFEGSTVSALQAGIDYLAAAGGGTLEILPGDFVFNNALKLRSGVSVRGSGPETRFKKNDYLESPLAIDSDWYESSITLSNPDGFEEGMGIALFANAPHHNGQSIVKRTLIGRDGSRFLLDQPLGENFWADHEAIAKVLFPLISGEEIQNVEIENLRIEGNRQNNPNFNGNYGGCIFMQDCQKVIIRGVETVDYNGDGISWQICHDVRVEDCLSQGNADLGFHPGSGSQRPVIRNNRSIENGIGIFFCWGVKNGIAEDNEIVGNRDYGVSIGHRDNRNRVANNRIQDSGKVGVLFRKETGGRDPLNNTIEKNVIVDSGEFGVDLQGNPAGTLLSSNDILQEKHAGTGVGVRIGEEVVDLHLEDNRISGFETETLDLRSA
ncbi:MAG: right-handed parallel beta-helix repeat-containing protein [Candidatus Omnitrophica bacterium]|nr:right-handed parallel beta-helix repeat-containing protein [Candidatus Omnitrophota bacterium]